MRPRSILLSAALVASLALAASACSRAPSSDDEADEGALSEVPALKVIAARELARCWFVVGGDPERARLACTTPSKGNDPLDVSLEITAKPAGARARAVTRTLTVPARGASKVRFGSFAASSFPIELSIKMVATPETANALGARTLELRQQRTVENAADFTAAAPAILKLPFDLIPIGFIDTSHTDDFSVRASYSVPVAPFAAVASDGRSLVEELRLEPAFTVERGPGKGKMAFFPKPSSGSIPLEMRAGSAGFTSTPMAAPGYFVLTEKGPTPASPREILAAFPRDDDAPTNANTNTNANANADAGESAPVDSDPSCGGANQSACSGTVCDDGTRWEVFARKCIPCGAAGQPSCFASPDNNGGDPACNEGTRYDSFERSCLACGTEGLTYCVDGPRNASGDPYCADGARYDAFGRKCLGCGGEGETYCVDGPDNASGNPTCESALHYEPLTKTCVR